MVMVLLKSGYGYGYGGRYGYGLAEWQAEWLGDLGVHLDQDINNSLYLLHETKKYISLHLHFFSFITLSLCLSVFQKPYKNTFFYDVFFHHLWNKNTCFRKSVCFITLFLPYA
jgi:hypothetical protein